MHQGRRGARFRLTRSCIAIGLLLATAAFAPRVDAATAELLHTGLNRPIFATGIDYPGVGELLYIVEQRGVILVSVDGGAPQVFLDIDSQVTNVSGNDERGLLGFALHPDFVSNGQYFVNYTQAIGGETTISRFTIAGGDPTDGNEASEEILLEIDQPFANHNGGWMGFSPIDGYLYISTGDGGSGGDPGNRAQNINVLLGKMLRIDPDGGAPYGIPADNPFVGVAGEDEIWSYGLRNAWRCSFDRENGDLWIADVGQGQWEEIDYEPAQTPGRNYGWRLLEGFECYNPSTNCDPGGVTTLPIHVYSHAVGFSVTGGYVYRGSAAPALIGHYFFADFLTNRIWTLTYDGDNAVVTDRTNELDPPDGSLTSISSFGEDADGELLFCKRGSSITGQIWRLAPNASDVPDQQPAAVSLLLRLDSANPFQDRLDFRIAQQEEGPIEVRVLTADGRQIRALAPVTTSAGERHYSWDGRDDKGHETSSGVYFIQATQETQTVTRRIDRIR